MSSALARPPPPPGRPSWAAGPPRPHARFAVSHQPSPFSCLCVPSPPPAVLPRAGCCQASGARQWTCRRSRSPSPPPRTTCARPSLPQR
eukprot:scaffold11429_cov109-Isochrysis_galbana.AAC.6